MIVVPRVNTPIPLRQLESVIEAGFELLQARITPTQRRNLAVLVAVETGRGQKAQNFNLGNISASEKYQGAAWRPPWFETPGPLHDAMKAGKAPSAFRAYSSFLEGAQAFAELLLRPEFGNVMRAAEGEDVAAFIEALSTRYSPDYSVAKHFKTFDALKKELGGTTQLVATRGDGIMVALALTALYFAAKKYL